MAFKNAPRRLSQFIADKIVGAIIATADDSVDGNGYNTTAHAELWNNGTGFYAAGGLRFFAVGLARSMAGGIAGGRGTVAINSGTNRTKNDGSLNPSPASAGITLQGGNSVDPTTPPLVKIVSAPLALGKTPDDGPAGLVFNLGAGNGSGIEQRWLRSINGGSNTKTTNSNGQFTFNHGLGAVPDIVTLTQFGAPLRYFARVSAANATQVTVTMVDVTTGAAAGININCNYWWEAKIFTDQVPAQNGP